MVVFVSKEIPAEKCGFPRGEIFRIDPVVAGSLVLNPHRGEAIAQREKKIVMIEVTCAVKLVGLPYEFAMNIQNLGWHRKEFRTIRHNVQSDSGTAAGIEVNLVEMLTGNNRGICKGLERDRLESDHAIRCCRRIQSGSELPACRELQPGFNLHLPRVVAGGV